jgi:hypothetical protein
MNLSVRTSQIPKAGKGLFADEDIPRGSLVVEYTGEWTTWAQVKDDWQNFYLYVIDDDHVINARNYPDVYARYANDAEGLTAVKGLRNNCEFVNIEGKVFIKAIKDIKAGEEILVGYGKEYWDTVRKNMV